MQNLRLSEETAKAKMEQENRNIIKNNGDMRLKRF